MFNPVPWFSGRTARPSTTIAKASVKPSSQMSHLQTHMGVEGPVTNRASHSADRKAAHRAPVPWMRRWPSCWESHGAGTP